MSPPQRGLPWPHLGPLCPRPPVWSLLEPFWPSETNQFLVYGLHSGLPGRMKCQSRDPAWLVLTCKHSGRCPMGVAGWMTKEVESCLSPTQVSGQRLQSRADLSWSSSDALGLMCQRPLWGFLFILYLFLRVEHLSHEVMEGSGLRKWEEEEEEEESGLRMGSSPLVLGRGNPGCGGSELSCFSKLKPVGVGGASDHANCCVIEGVCSCVCPVRMSWRVFPLPLWAWRGPWELLVPPAILQDSLVTGCRAEMSQEIESCFGSRRSELEFWLGLACAVQL